MLTLATMSTPELIALNKAKESAGGSVALAAALSAAGPKLTSQAVSQWKRVPAERVIEVERLTGVSRHELRPDVFGPAASTASEPATSEAGAAA